MKKPLSREQMLLLQRLAGKRKHRVAKQSRNLQAKSAPVRPEYRNWKIVKLPENFTLSANYDKVVKIINRMKMPTKKRCYINFNAIRRVSTAAALMLAAELDVDMISSGAKKMQAHDLDWDPKVSELLKQMGFLDLLRAESEINQPAANSGNGEVFIKFASGNGLADELIDKIIQETEKHVASGKIARELRFPLFAGMSEAMTNTCQHAYEQKTELNRWWISASVNRTTGEIVVVCYDRGRMIPGTLRASESKLARFLSHFTDSDHTIICNALQRGQTSTHQLHRGKGLPELIRLIDENRQGILKIYSGDGMVKYDFAGESGENRYFSRSLGRKMRGTLVEWSIIPSKRFSEAVS